MQAVFCVLLQPIVREFTRYFASKACEDRHDDDTGRDPLCSLSEQKAFWPAGASTYSLATSPNASYQQGAEAKL
jgi:hypothetical protein